MKNWVAEGIASDVNDFSLQYIHTDKSKVKISQNVVAFSEYMNFNCQIKILKLKEVEINYFFTFSLVHLKTWHLHLDFSALIKTCLQCKSIPCCILMEDLKCCITLQVFFSKELFCMLTFHNGFKSCINVTFTKQEKTILLKQDLINTWWVSKLARQSIPKL